MRRQAPSSLFSQALYHYSKPKRVFQAPTAPSRLKKKKLFLSSQPSLSVLLTCITNFPLKYSSKVQPQNNAGNAFRVYLTSSV
jgi:hypothetical protein